MLTLALDTTTRAGSVAVADDDHLLAVVHGNAAKTHGERLPGEIDRALTEAGLAAADLQLLAVACGPGAFTGLRIGLATVQGLAMVLERPVVGVSALDALAHAAQRVVRPEPSSIVAWMDAQRGEVFGAYYAGRAAGEALPSPSETPIVGAPDSLLATLPPEILASAVFVGDGAVRYRDLIVSQTGGAHRVLPPPAALAPAIAAIGRLLASRGETVAPHALQPLYVRRSDAELARQRRDSL